MTIRRWIAKNVLKVETEIFNLPESQAVDYDDDYRGAGKTRMRMNAARNHLRNNPSGSVLYITNTQQRAEQLRKEYRHYYDHDKRITFVGKSKLSLRMIGRRYTKTIYDLWVD